MSSSIRKADSHKPRSTCRHDSAATSPTSAGTHSSICLNSPSVIGRPFIAFIFGTLSFRILGSTGKPALEMAW